MQKILRFIAILFMSLTAVFTILGGIGTTCVALAAENYDSMTALVPYKWLYVLFVLATVAIGVMGARAVVLLVKGMANAYRYSIIALVAGVIVGVIHMLVSRSLRGSSMPVDAVVYTTAITLIIFLCLRIPGVWEKVDWSRTQNKETDRSSGVAAIVCGILCLSIQIWMGPTHTFGGVNYADAFHAAMNMVGWGLILAGILLSLNAVQWLKQDRGIIQILHRQLNSRI
jgi:hypothetical protein